MSGADEPVLSIVVPTYNRRERLARVLRSLAAQQVDADFEVVVVSDGSTDGTDDYLLNGALPLAVTPLFQPNQGPAAARNHGVERARGELVLFLDDDVVAEPGLVQAHLDAHGRLGDRVVVIGPMLDPPDHVMSPWIAWEQMMLRKQYDDMDAGRYTATARQFYTGNASVRIEHVRDVGGFDPAFRRAEDIELAFRLDDIGLDFHFEPSARGLHYAERSYEAWKSAARSYGRNDVAFARDLGRVWLYPFARERFERHHPVIRSIVRQALTSPRRRQRYEEVCERIVRSPLARSPAGRYALSCVYGIELHLGLLDELGSAERCIALITTGDPG